MPTVSRPSASTRATSHTEPRRSVALKKLEAAVKAAGGIRTAKEARHLERLDRSVFLTPRGKALVSDIGEKDRSKLELSPPLARVMVDDKNKEFYFDAGGRTFGPLPLPRGVSAKDLYDDGRSVRRGQNPYERSIEKLTRVVQKALPEAELQGSSHLDFDYGAFRAPSGEALYHHYLDTSGHNPATHFQLPGGALMLGKEQFWVELIPGISGHCLGPFDYPRGFSREAIEAMDAAASGPPPAAPDARFERDSSRPRSILVGGSSESWRPSAPRGGGGGSGSWPASWGPAPGGRGS